MSPLHPTLHEVGYKGYCEYFHGAPTSSVIICAPHAGHLRPSHIPDRKKQCCNGKVNNCTFAKSKNKGISLLKDSYTYEMAVSLRNNLSLMLGDAPHMVICNLHRRKLDANRERDVAAQHNGDAEQAFDDYHSFIQKAHDTVTLNQKTGILFDVHGQSHAEKWIELGYTISGPSLDAPGTPSSHLSSIRHLATHRQFEMLLRGTDSLGGRLEEQGYKVIPSPTFPGPANGNYYFGGFTTVTWGSREQGSVDAIQLELPLFIRKNHEEHGPILASILADFVADNYLMPEERYETPPLVPRSGWVPQLFWSFLDKIFL